MATQRKTTPKKTTAATTKPRTRRKTRLRVRAGQHEKSRAILSIFSCRCFLFCAFCSASDFSLLWAIERSRLRRFSMSNRLRSKGTNKVAREEIEKIVRLESEKNGVWNADLQKIREEIEKTNFVKTATVSRILPDGIRVNITERKPTAVARIDGGDFWVDEDGAVLVLVGKDEARPPFFIQGWNREKSEKAQAENKERVKIYLEMLNQWQEFELAKRVESVDLTDIKEPLAITQDSGERVSIELEIRKLCKQIKGRN